MKCAFLIFLVNFFLLAQGGVGRDTVLLEEVVKVEKLSNANGISPFIDLKYKQGERLSDALGEFSSVYIKSYGSGGLASLAIRGTTATQTEIQWNGIKINSPSLGQVDLSLFLLGMQDELHLVHTGYQGNIGGVLQMENTIKRDSGFSAGITFRTGSFKTYNLLADATYAQGRFSGSTRFGYLSSANIFLYRNSFKEGSPQVRQTNDNVSQLAFMQQFYALVNDKNELSFYLWMTDANRQIPPLMSQQNSLQSQLDYSIRAMANWSGHFKALQLKFTTAYLHDFLNYKDPNALLDETSVMKVIRNQMHFNYTLPVNLVLSGAVNYDHEQAKIKAYSGLQGREMFGLKAYADYYFKNMLKLHAGFREDVAGKQFSPFAPEVAFNYTMKPVKGSKLSAGVIASRNFRFPTLNDLFWVPGGNPLLKPEKSWNGDITLRYGYKHIVELSVSDFNIYADNWIQWVPTASNWQAENFRRVFSRGVEAALHLSNDDGQNARGFIVHGNLSYTYTKTTNLDGVNANDASAGKQMIYVPYHNLVAELQLQYRRFYLRAIANYTGDVFTSTDNLQVLKGYMITNLEIGKDFALKNIDLGFSFRVNNVGDVQYQVVAQRPMPGRNFEGTLRFKFYN